MEEDELAELSPQWCLIGNIVDERRAGPGGEELWHGTKHFSPGTKVYVLRGLWGDGFEKAMVIGQCRRGKRWIKVVIHSKWITNWRAKLVYQPAVLRRLYLVAGRAWWDSEEEVQVYVDGLLKRERERAAKQPEISED